MYNLVAPHRGGVERVSMFMRDCLFGKSGCKITTILRNSQAFWEIFCHATFFQVINMGKIKMYRKWIHRFLSYYKITIYFCNTIINFMSNGR